MKCPKCSYTSFDYLDKCRKCGADLTDVRNLIQIISVPPEEKAPVFARGADSHLLPEPAPADDLFGRDLIDEDGAGGEADSGQDLLSGLNFDQSFSDLVEPTAVAAAPAASPEREAPAFSQDDGLLDLDFGDVFGDSSSDDGAEPAGKKG